LGEKDPQQQDRDSGFSLLSAKQIDLSDFAKGLISAIALYVQGN
jgi:hypothetical protein